MTTILQRIIALPFNFWRYSLRRQLIFAFSSVTMTLLLLFSAFLFLQQRDFLDQSAVKQAKALAHALSNSSSSWVLANDVVGLQEVLEGFGNTPDLKRAYVLSLRGEILSSTKIDEIGRYVVDPVSRKMLAAEGRTQVLLANAYLIDVAEPVFSGSRQVGWARISLSRASAHANLQSLFLVGLTSSLVGALLSFIAAVMLARRLTKNLSRLMSATNQVAEGRRDVRVPVDGIDEIAILAGDFNKMLDALTRSEQKRKLITDVYAAWTQCAEVMVRVNDEQELLQKICQIVAGQLALKLVWVGMIDVDGWVVPAAMSPEQSDYLGRIKVSVNADLPEGQGPIGMAIRQAKPEILNDFSRHQASKAWHNAARAENIKSAGAFPLFRNGNTIGAITIYSSEKRYFHQELISLMHGLANDISFALDNLDLVRRQKIAEAKIKLDACVFDNSQEGIVITDAGFRIVSVNRGFTRITGYSENEILGAAPDILVMPEQLPHYKPIWKAVKTQGNWQGEIDSRRSNGEHYPAWVSITHILDDQGVLTHYIAVFSDITVRKKTEQALAYEKALLRSVIDAISDLIFFKDTASHYMGCNKAFGQYTGCTEHEIVGKTDYDFVDKEHAEFFRAKDFSMLASGKAQQNEEWIPFADGGGGFFETIKTPFYGERGEVLGLVGISRNITERKQAEQDLKIAAIAFETEEGIVVTDANNIILRVNRAFTRLTGYSPEETIGKNPSILNSGRQPDEFYQQMWQALEQEGYWEGELWNRRKNGEVYPEWLTLSAVRNQENAITHYVGIFSDISQRKAAEEQIRQLAFYDPLTALPNRRLLVERLESALITSHRTQHNGAMMFLDLDHFKTLNDTQGHDWGDQLLIEVASRLQECVREADTVARLGGDEFVIILERLDKDLTTAAMQAQTVAEKIKNALARGYQLMLVQQGEEHSINHYSSASIGFVMFQGRTTKADELLKWADMAMYQAKHAGRNAICAYDPGLQQALNVRVALESDLRLALAKEQLHPYYQVQVDVFGKPVGAELLLRWVHPEHGFISPEEFIPIAEESSLIHEISQWLLVEGCRTLAHWAANPKTQALQLSINVSAKQFYHLDIVAQVRDAIYQTGINPALLKLEITESLILHNVKEVITKMREINALGVAFSMDDFGTGYSSLSYLQELPLEQIKIDRSFVRDLSVDEKDAAIVRTILTLGRTLGMNIVAEGVETQEQFDYLAAHGCLIFQGYLFGKAESLTVFEANLMDTRCLTV